MLIPAALEGQINAETVQKISKRVKIVAEGANGPTTPEADEVFKRRGVYMIPDFLCNAGGVTCSYFEGVQNDMNYLLDPRRSPRATGHQDDPGYHGVQDMAQKEKVYMRDAAYMVAIARVVKAMELRGLI